MLAENDTHKELPLTKSIIIFNGKIKNKIATRLIRPVAPCLCFRDLHFFISSYFVSPIILIEEEAEATKQQDA